MKTRLLLVIALVIFILSTACYAATLNVVPKTIQGLSDITSIGKKIASEVDVDAHQVAIIGSSQTSYNGINLVEYTSTDPEIETLYYTWQNFQVEVQMVEGGPKRNATVTARERDNDKAYKVTFDMDNAKILLEQITNNTVTKTATIPYSLKLGKIYKVTFNFGPESSGGANGNRITIEENNVTAMHKPTTKIIYDVKLYQIGFDEPAYSNRLFKFFVGSNRASVRFQNEQINLAQ